MKAKAKRRRYLVVTKTGRVLCRTASEHYAYGFAQGCGKNVRIEEIKTTTLWLIRQGEAIPVI